MDQNTSVGQRIRYWRKRRGVKVAVLANQVDRSTSWLEKIERGDLICDRVSILLALANILKIGLGDLIGGVELPPNGGGPHEPPKGMHAIRRALMAPRPPDREPRPVAELRADVERAKRLGKRCSLTALAGILPDLIIDCRDATADDDPAAWRNLADIYRRTAVLAHHVGDAQLGWIAADREVMAAERCEDELLVAAGHRQVALALMRQGWVDQAGAVCSDAADAIAPTDATAPAGWSVWGCLQLTNAAAASRNAHTAGAWRLLRGARVAADRGDPEGDNEYDGSFGPANVTAHEVDVALEAGDPVEALRIAGPLDVDALANPERRARFCIDTAHAHQLRNNDPAAVASLLEAERHGPEVVRYSVKARELVRVCLKRERKTLTPGLRPLAERLNVTV